MQQRSKPTAGNKQRLAQKGEVMETTRTKSKQAVRVTQRKRTVRCPEKATPGKWNKAGSPWRGETEMWIMKHTRNDGKE